MRFSWDKKGRSSTIDSTYFTQEIPEDGFDAIGNLKKLIFTDVTGKESCHFKYDDLYQLTQEKGAFDHTYKNDSLHNRIEEDGLFSVHDNANKLLKNKNALFSYDKNGNVIQKIEDDKTTTYRYDALDRLIEATGDHYIASYTYDSFNRRIRKECSYLDESTNIWSNPHILQFIYLGDREVGALNHRQKMVEFRVIGRGKGAEIGATVAIEMNGAIYCPLHDHRGNIVAFVDAENNTVIEARRYSAFGDVKKWSEEPVKTQFPWGFASKRFDEETGFYYFGKRYYSPATGRWVTPDPAGFGDGPNLYAYVFNSPLCLFDPYGLSAEEYTNVYPPSFNPDSTAYPDNPGCFDVGINSIKNGFVTFTNGMKHTPIEAKKAALGLSKSHGDVKITVVYNPTHTAWKAKENMRSPVTSSTNVSSLLKEKWDKFISENKEKGEILSIAHSDGSSHARKALESLDAKDKKRIHIANFAPSKPTPSTGLAGARNYVSKNDVVPYADRTLDGFFHGLDDCWGLFPELPGETNYREAEKDMVILDPASGTSKLDHSFDSPTFDDVKRKEFNNFKQDCENK